MEKQLISKRHEDFLEGLLAGKSLVVAGKDAGFSTPGRDAIPIINDPQVRSYVRKRLKGALDCEGAPYVYHFMMSVVRDENADKKLRVEVAKYLFAAAGYTPPKAAEAPEDAGKAPSEMSNEELRTFIEQGETELANRAQPVNTPQPLDSYL